MKGKGKDKNNKIFQRNFAVSFKSKYLTLENDPLSFMNAL